MSKDNLDLFENIVAGPDKIIECAVQKHQSQDDIETGKLERKTELDAEDGEINVSFFNINIYSDNIQVFMKLERIIGLLVLNLSFLFCLWTGELVAWHNFDFFTFSFLFFF